MKLSVVLITKNEEANIERCLKSVRWADEMIVVDSESTDSTREIASRYTSRILIHPFVNFSSQKNFALSQALGDWIFLIDADEAVTPELASEIREIASSSTPPKIYAVRRTTYFFGKRLRFSGTQNDKPIRLFPRGKASYIQPVHEEIVSDLPLDFLKSPLLHYTTRHWAHYQKKLNDYIPFEMEIMKQQKRNCSLLDLLGRPVARFLHHYFFQLGILDGWTGFVYASLSAYYTWLKYDRYYKTVKS